MYILTKFWFPVKLHLLKPAGIASNFFQRVAPCLFFMAMGFGSIYAAQNFGADVTNFAATDPAANVGNYPNVYVTKVQPDVTNGLGGWMWDKVTLNKQTVRLWHGFEVPKTNPVIHVELRITGDNAFKVWLDGQELGIGSDWRTLSIYHLEGRLDPGAHVLAVEGFNDNDQAGIILGMTLEMAKGQVMQISSDPAIWRVVPNSERGWEAALHPDADWPTASVATNFGRLPWWSVPTSVLHIREALPEPIQIWQSREFQIGLFVGCGVFVLACLYLLIQLVSQSKAHRLVQAERDRIARDIHDDLGSKLTHLLLTGEVAQIDSPPAASEPLSQMCDGARNILATIDEVVWIVDSQHDNLDDFVIYLCKHTQNFLDATGIRCRFYVPAELPAKTLNQFMRRNLFLAIKEALNNAAKHSEATELTVRIDLNGSRLNVVVVDNGCGFDCAQASQERNGLSNMKLRMTEIGGDCQVVSRPGDGCQVLFQVLLEPEPFLKSFFKSQPPDNGISKIQPGDKHDPLPAK
jgi:signal transduction histidine kinase